MEKSKKVEKEFEIDFSFLPNTPEVGAALKKMGVAEIERRLMEHLTGVMRKT